MKVTIDEIIKTLVTGSARDCRQLAERIKKHGIAPPSGYCIVPIEPTDKMLAWADVYAPLNHSDRRMAYRATYEAMLEASKDKP